MRGASMYGGTAVHAKHVLSKPQVKFIPMAPARRRKVEPVSGAMGVVEDIDLKHVVHVVRHGYRACTVRCTYSERRRAAPVLHLVICSVLWLACAAKALITTSMARWEANPTKTSS
jgi:hypothetical protein